MRMFQVLVISGGVLTSSRRPSAVLRVSALIWSDGSFTAESRRTRGATQRMWQIRHFYFLTVETIVRAAVSTLGVRMSSPSDLALAFAVLLRTVFDVSTLSSLYSRESSSLALIELAIAAVV